MDILVNTIPKNARNREAANLGYEIVSKVSEARRVNWWDNIEYNGIDEVGFNVFYPTHIFNAFAFMNKHNIPFEKTIWGGQGVSNSKLDLNIYRGEMDSNYTDIKGWERCNKLISPPLIKHKYAVIELTRGCNHRCSFCEYGWVTGGSYRPKEIKLVTKQIDYCVHRGIFNINFLTTNFAGYPDIKELIHYCRMNNVNILNRDVYLQEIDKLWEWIEREKIHYLKIGVESFDEKTRISVGKKVTDDKLERIIDRLLKTSSSIHLYLIHGLPGDNYDEWFRWVKLLGDKRKSYTKMEKHLFGERLVNTKNIRIEMSITNFEPCVGTPLENAKLVDFDVKDKFLKGWNKALSDAGFIRNKQEVTYATGRGRLGRKKLSYNMLMALKQRPLKVDNIFNIFPKGIGRSISDEQADKFLNKIGD